jgi:pimeloyl-ACP methyl ester carboxylesterase
MSVMALAESHPELFGPRVKAVALLSTAPGRLGELTFGLPAVVGTVARRVIPHAVPVLGKRAALVDHGRRVGGDIAFLATRQLAFGSNVSPSVVEFMEQMVAGTPFDVIADFYADFKNHDKLAALTTLDGLPTLVLCGERDKITPADHSRSIVDSLPGAELVIVPATGHMVMLERPAVLTAHLRVLMSRATRAADAQPA